MASGRSDMGLDGVGPGSLALLLEEGVKIHQKYRKI